MRVLKVQGSGRASAPPDMVILKFDVEAEAYEYGRSIGRLNGMVEELRQNIVAAGLERSDLKTTSFDVRSTKKLVDDEYVFAGYKASHTLSIRLPMDKERLNLVLNTVATGHSGTGVSLTFSVEDRAKLKKHALVQAVRRARANAETLAAASGVALGALQQIAYGAVDVRLRNTRVDFLCNSISATMGPMADIEATDVRADEEVTLIYRIGEETR